MTIDASNLNAATPTAANYLNRTVETTTGSASARAATASTVESSALSDAAQTIQSHLSGRTDPPQFKVDYLSGLDVMTVRAAANGEVVFQIPGPAAIRLAQLLKEGAPVESFGLLDKTA